MGTPERIPEQDRRQTDLTPLIERRGGQERREAVRPAWLRRMQQQGLPPKDMTQVAA